MNKLSQSTKKPTVSRKSAATTHKRPVAKKTTAQVTRSQSRNTKGLSRFGLRGDLMAIVVLMGAMFGALGALSVNFSSPSYADTALGPIVGIGNKCIDNRDNKMTNGNAIHLWDCNGGPAQKWLRTTSGTIKNQNSNYCLDVQYASKTPGTIVQLYTCNGTVAQVWQPQSNGSLVNPNSGLCLDDKYASTANGNQITVYICNGTPAQNWKLPPNVNVQPAPIVSQSGVPQGDLAGWKQIMAEDFKTDSPIGKFQTTYKNSWCGYNESGKYFNNKIISAHDGVMDFNLDGKLGGAGSFGPGALCHGQVYGRFSMRIKATGAADNGTAIMVWPSSDVWGDGEIDYPEGNFDKTLGLYHHGMGCTQCASSDALDTKANWQTWHTVTVEWLPSSVKYYLDGSLIKTVTHDVPTTKHRYTIQMAPNGSNPKSGHFLVDWVAIYSRS